MLKINGQIAHIKEQIIDDKVTGLMLTIRVTPSGEARIHLMGDLLPFGNRDFQFDTEGNLAGTGTSVS